MSDQTSHEHCRYFSTELFGPTHLRYYPVSREIPRYAVVFRVHFWDDYARRQLQRLIARVRHGHVFVLADTTKQRIENIDHDRVVYVNEDATAAMGLISAGIGPNFWFNGDYPLYYFASLVVDYDYIICYEYDVLIDFDIDEFVARVAQREADFVALTKGSPPSQWTMRYTCEKYYPPASIVYKLFSFSLFSKQALGKLYARRVAMAEMYSPSDPGSWPFCEGFIATELQVAGLKTCELSEFVDVSDYDYWPPYYERDVPDLLRGAITHPVLDRGRYIESIFRYPTGATAYFNPKSLLHCKLRRLDLETYAVTLVSSFSVKVHRLALKRIKAAIGTIGRKTQLIRG